MVVKLVQLALDELDLMIDRNTVIGWIRRGELPGVKMGRRWYVSTEDLRKALTPKQEKRWKRTPAMHAETRAIRVYQDEARRRALRERLGPAAGLARPLPGVELSDTPPAILDAAVDTEIDRPDPLVSEPLSEAPGTKG